MSLDKFRYNRKDSMTEIKLEIKKIMEKNKESSIKVIFTKWLLRRTWLSIGAAKKSILYALSSKTNVDIDISVSYSIKIKYLIKSDDAVFLWLHHIDWPLCSFIRTINIQSMLWSSQSDNYIMQKLYQPKKLSILL